MMSNIGDNVDNKIMWALQDLARTLFVWILLFKIKQVYYRLKTKTTCLFIDGSKVQRNNKFCQISH